MPGQKITIRHTRAGGTLIEGSRRGDGAWEVLKAQRAGWRYFRSLGVLGLGQSRDKAASTWKIIRAAEALRAAGFEVTVDIDDTTPGRTTAEIEADRSGRAAGRAAWHEEHAGRAARSSQAAYAAEHGILDMIPPGQPILAGHHSERRHRRDLARADALYRRGRAEAQRAGYHAGRAAAAEDYQARRESVPAILRRIARLEAEQRQVQRRLDGAGLALHGEDQPAVGDRRARLEARAAELTGELDYWRTHLKKQQDDGAKVWSPADFAPGDYALSLWGLCEVLRVNAKSVTIPDTLGMPGPLIVSRAAADACARARGSRRTDTRTVPYDKIQGRKTADEAAQLLAKATAEGGAA